jgi:hypothetical protein
MGTKGDLMSAMMTIRTEQLSKPGMVWENCIIDESDELAAAFLGIGDSDDEDLDSTPTGSMETHE